jgi:hypothetical protein
MELRVLYLLTAIAAAIVGFATGPAAADEGDDFKVVDGLAVYLGVLPAAMIRGHPGTHSESAMHGGPGTPGDDHLVVAIFDASSGERVGDAEVTAAVEALGHVGRQRQALEPMLIAGTVTYGGFITPPDRDRYTIAIEIRQPGQAGPLRVEFTHRRTAP